VNRELFCATWSLAASAADDPSMMLSRSIQGDHHIRMSNFESATPISDHHSPSNHSLSMSPRPNERLVVYSGYRITAKDLHTIYNEIPSFKPCTRGTGRATDVLSQTYKAWVRSLPRQQRLQAPPIQGQWLRPVKFRAPGLTAVSQRSGVRPRVSQDSRQIQRDDRRVW
jgi:hypothetical protein